MKLVFPVIFAFVCSLAYGYEIKSVDGVVFIQKYQYQGRPIYSDAERDAIIAGQGVVCASCTAISAADFAPVAVSTTEAAILAEIQNDGKAKTRSEFMNERDTRNTKDYALDQMKKSYADTVSLNTIKTQGLAVDSGITAKQAEFEKWKSRYGTLGGK